MMSDADFRQELLRSSSVNLSTSSAFTTSRYNSYTLTASVLNLTEMGLKTFLLLQVLVGINAIPAQIYAADFMIHERQVDRWEISGSRSLFENAGSTLTDIPLSPASDKWIPPSSWQSWDDMVAVYQPIMGVECENGFDNQDSETQFIIDTILDITTEGEVAEGFDPRFLLATVMQESSGCIRQDTNYGWNANTGLMQAYDGFSCERQQVCPESTIRCMIIDGSFKSAKGSGLVEIKNILGLDMSAGKHYFMIGRYYNSGPSADLFDLDAASTGNPAYCDDILRRVRDLWFIYSGCQDCAV